MAIVSAVSFDFKGGKVPEKDKKTSHHLKMKVGDVQEIQFLVSNYTDTNWSSTGEVYFTSEIFNQKLQCRDFGLNKENQCAFMIRISIVDQIPP
jgi:hypothetical protein